MPALIAEDPQLALESTPGHRIAFVFCCQRAVFDYEDPSVAVRYLRVGLDGEEPATDPSLVHQFWSVLPLEVAIATFLNAGMASACRATATCTEWRNSAMAQGIREQIYAATTGFNIGGISAGELGSILGTRQLLLTGLPSLESFQQHANRRSEFAQDGITQKPILLPADGVALFVDDVAIFAVLCSGELRCYRTDTGQCLGTSQAKKTSKRLHTTSALFLNKEAFVLGDDSGGLTFISRDDLSESVSLRKKASAAVSCLGQLDDRHMAVVHANGCLDILQICSDCSGVASCVSISVSMRLPSSLAPALGVLVAGKTLVLVATGDSLWTWHEGLEAPRQATKLLDEIPAGTDGRCHLITLRSAGSNEIIVTASTACEDIHWWTTDGHQATLVDCSVLKDGRVVSLASSRSLAVSLHTNRGLKLWHGESRTMALKLDVADWLHTVTIDSSGFLVGGVSAECGSFFLRFLGTRPVVGDEVQPTQPKKAKPAKMFANKARGGRKNQARAVGKTYTACHGYNRGG